MDINTHRDGNTLVVEAAGRLDTTTAPEFTDELNKSLTDDVTKLIIDFENLEYISSAGLRALLSAHKKMSAKDGMTVRNVNDVVEEVLDVTGFLDILNVERV